MKNTVIGLFAISGVCLSSCNEVAVQKTEPESFPVTTVVSKDTFTYADYVAEIDAVQNVEIRARVTGYLEKIYVDEGSFVQEGQLLFTINKREYEEEFAKAKALFKSVVADKNAAELELKNVMQLAEKKIVSETEVELAKNKLEVQKAKMEEAQAHQAYAQLKLSNTDIKAPFSGVINRIPRKTGSLVEEGTLLTTISQNDEVFAYFDVSEKEYLSYARNLKSDNESASVSLILADGSEHPFKGKIETMDGAIDPATGNIAFRARFENPDKIIRHGASGRVRLQKKIQNAIIVPQKSTFEIQDKVYVYVVDTQNKVRVRNIEPLQRLTHLFIVGKGINEGEKIIYEGIQGIKPDMVIKPEEKNMRQIFKELASR